MADMRPEAVTARLRELSRLLAERGIVAKGVDMSGPAISARLRTLGALSDACRRLKAIGESLSPRRADAQSRSDGT